MPHSPGQAHGLRQRQVGQSGRGGKGSPCRQRSKSAGGRPGGSLKQGMWSRGEQNSGRFWCNDGGE